MLPPLTPTPGVVYDEDLVVPVSTGSNNEDLVVPVSTGSNICHKWTFGTSSDRDIKAFGQLQSAGWTNNIGQQTLKANYLGLWMYHGGEAWGYIERVVPNGVSSCWIDFSLTYGTTTGQDVRVLIGGTVVWENTGATNNRAQWSFACSAGQKFRVEEHKAVMNIYEIRFSTANPTSQKWTFGTSSDRDIKAFGQLQSAGWTNNIGQQTLKANYLGLWMYHGGEAWGYIERVVPNGVSSCWIDFSLTYGTTTGQDVRVLIGGTVVWENTGATNNRAQWSFACSAGQKFRVEEHKAVMNIYEIRFGTATCIG